MHGTGMDLRVNSAEKSSNDEGIKSEIAPSDMNIENIDESQGVGYSQFIPTFKRLSSGRVS